MAAGDSFASFGPRRQWGRLDLGSPNHSNHGEHRDAEQNLEKKNGLGDERPDREQRAKDQHGVHKDLLPCEFRAALGDTSRSVSRIAR